jgi:hypothetical protein
MTLQKQKFTRKSFDVEAIGYTKDVPFYKPCFVCEHTLIANDELKPLDVSKVSADVKPVPGFGALYRLIADGTHAPTFSGFKKIKGTEDFDTTLDAINVISFTFDGVDYWYTIIQEAEAEA